MPTALVTGATGLVGSHLTERLLAEGWRVHALVRDPARARWLADMGAELRAGDVLDAAGFAAAARGSDVLFHTAAVITPHGGWEAFRRTNLDGTRNAIDAAAGAGARLLQLSSVAVYGPHARYESPTGKTDEETPLVPIPERAWYARSKRESETMVMAAHGAGRIWATAIRPCVIYGTRDRQFTPRVARAFTLLPALPLLGGGRTALSIIHVSNVVDVALRAVALDAAGGRAYNVANDHEVTLAGYVRLAGEGLDRRLRTFTVPLGAVRVVDRLLRLVSGNALKVMPGATRDFLTRGNPFSSERARRELGWSPLVRPEEGIPEAFRWWRTHRAEGAAA